MTTERDQQVWAVDDAIRRFKASVEGVYGARLDGVYLFGSRARQQHRRDSDVDLAVVVDVPHIRHVDEMHRLGDLAFAEEVQTGLLFHVWPFSRSEWLLPRNSSVEALVRGARKDAVRL